MKNYNAKFKTFHFGLLFFILTFLFFNALPIFVQNSAAEEYNFKESSGLNKTADKTSGAGYDTNQTSLPKKIGKIIGAALSFVGVIFLLLMIYGGYTWMTASGNEQQVEKAKGIIKNAVIGLIVVLAAYVVTAFIYWELGIYYSDNRM